jgi:hypothetical protein
VIVHVVDSNGPANVGDMLCDIATTGYLTVGSVRTKWPKKNIVTGWFPGYSKKVLAHDVHKGWKATA